jgi:hypothetical protein
MSSGVRAFHATHKQHFAGQGIHFQAQEAVVVNQHA